MAMAQNQLPKIMAHSESHANHSNSEFVTYVHPYW